MPCWILIIVFLSWLCSHIFRCNLKRRRCIKESLLCHYLGCIYTFQNNLAVRIGIDLWLTGLNVVGACIFIKLSKLMSKQKICIRGCAWFYLYSILLCCIRWFDFVARLWCISEKIWERNVSEAIIVLFFPLQFCFFGDFLFTFLYLLINKNNIKKLDDNNKYSIHPTLA